MAAALRAQQGRWARTGPGRPISVLGGWEFSPIFTWQGGLPLTINQPQAINIGGERRSRPNRIADGNLAFGSAHCRPLVRHKRIRTADGKHAEPDLWQFGCGDHSAPLGL